MTPEELRDKVREIVQDHPTKVWLTRTTGHRLDFLWSVGKTQLMEEETLAQCGRYYLLGENVSDELGDALVELFQEFCSSDYVINDKTVDRKIRLFFK